MAAGVPFGTSSHEGNPWRLFTLKAPNASGVTASVTNYGATLVSMCVPDRNGQLSDVVLGYEDVANYDKHVVSMGSTVGRFANRIAKGKFKLDGAEYKLVQNNGTNCLHGGNRGLAKKTWDVVASSENSVTLKYVSPHMEEGFPGTLTVTVEFALSASSDASEGVALHIRYSAVSDRPTVVNLTNHAYFNLAGHERGVPLKPVLDHVAVLNTDTFLPVDIDCVPVGEPESVEDSPFDFRSPTRIGSRIDDASAQLVYCSGYDHCFVCKAGEPRPAPAGTPQGMRCLGVELDGSGAPKRKRAADASLYDPSSGRRMETFTEEPGVHFFTNNIPQKILDLGGGGKLGVGPYTYRTGACFETQHFPDSPNHPNFPSTELRPGATYKSETVYWFTAER
eukprot:TRINITY_DN63583_c0_g1_i1.p1 TRINITY_DN63583_c0_g1~~TRINITY_DN63583_c0_g1_i1.p1  ORF type:complete len:419 (-),score=59.40 TRINITY_DN63583_c0_g1_i1:163-1344(-)